MKIQLPERTFWCTIGGGINPGETLADAAKRELFEETGLSGDDITWGRSIWYGEHILKRHGISLHHKETFVLAHTQQTELSATGFTDEEKSVVKELRWWTFGALEQTKTECIDLQPQATRIKLEVLEPKAQSRN